MEEEVRLLLARDEGALERLSERHGRLLLSLAERILRSRPDAEECVNDTLLEVWNTVPPRRPESVASYACMLVRRRAIDRLRRQTAAKRGGGEYCVALEEIEECVASAGAEMERLELRELLNEFLRGLPASDRTVFLARYFEFADIGQIAKMHATSKNAVNVRLSRVRARLKLFLEEKGETL